MIGWERQKRRENQNGNQELLKRVHEVFHQLFQITSSQFLFIQTMDFFSFNIAPSSENLNWLFKRQNKIGRGQL